MGSEGYINNLTAEFLMPAEHVGHIWNRQRENVKQICELSDVFKVSRIALAIKLKSMGLIDSKTVVEIKHKSVYEFTNRTGTPSGGDFYKTYHTRMSPVFTEAVIRSAESGEIGYTHAFKLLGGIKGSTYDKIKETMMPYE